MEHGRDSGAGAWRGQWSMEHGRDSGAWSMDGTVEHGGDSGACQTCRHLSMGWLQVCQGLFSPSRSPRLRSWWPSARARLVQARRRSWTAGSMVMASARTNWTNTGSAVAMETRLISQKSLPFLGPKLAPVQAAPDALRPLVKVALGTGGVGAGPHALLLPLHRDLPALHLHHRLQTEPVDSSN